MLYCIIDSFMIKPIESA